MIETSQKPIEDIVNHMMGMIADRL
jgi:hypothetical protein